MLFFGHIGISAFIAMMAFLPVLPVVIGVELPDIIDKGLLEVFHTDCGRLWAHTIYFPIIAGLVTLLVTRNKKWAIAVALGSSLHLIEDLHDFIPFFHPFVKYDFATICAPYIKVVFDPYIITTEIIGIGLLIFVFGFQEKFYRFRRAFWKLVNRGKDV